MRGKSIHELIYQQLFSTEYNWSQSVKSNRDTYCAERADTRTKVACTGDLYYLWDFIIRWREWQSERAFVISAACEWIFRVCEFSWHADKDIILYLRYYVISDTILYLRYYVISDILYLRYYVISDIILYLRYYVISDILYLRYYVISDIVSEILCHIWYFVSEILCHIWYHIVSEILCHIWYIVSEILCHILYHIVSEILCHIWCHIDLISIFSLENAMCC